MQTNITNIDPNQRACEPAYEIDPDELAEIERKAREWGCSKTRAYIRMTREGLVDTGSRVSKRELIHFLAYQRRAARTVLRNVEAMVDSSMAEARLVKKYRASGNPILIRNAEVIEARIEARKKDIAAWDVQLIDIGYALRVFTDDIDRLIPINELFDVLEVNPVDRSKAGAAPSFINIVFVHGLEDSATHRGSEWKEGPLFKAMARCMDDLMKNSPVLQQQITDGLFGKGGLFEFVPTYSRTASGEFKRNPPKLRLADETDLTANLAST